MTHDDRLALLTAITTGIQVSYHMCRELLVLTACALIVWGAL